MSSQDGRTKGWSLISHHGVVLVYLIGNPKATIRAVSDSVGITERHVTRIIKNLRESGLVEVYRDGPGLRNSYKVDLQASVEHLEAEGIESRVCELIKEAAAYYSEPTPAQKSRGAR